MGNLAGRNDIAENTNGADVLNTMGQLRDELLYLLDRRTAIMRRIGTVKRTIIGLTALFGADALDNDVRELVGIEMKQRVSGLTNTCRRILLEAECGMAAQDILNAIRSQNPSLLSTHKDPLASLNTVLNRLVTYGEAQRVLMSDNRRGWQWVEESDEGSPASKSSSRNSQHSLND